MWHELDTKVLLQCWVSEYSGIAAKDGENLEVRPAWGDQPRAPVAGRLSSEHASGLPGLLWKPRGSQTLKGSLPICRIFQKCRWRKGINSRHCAESYAQISCGVLEGGVVLGL